MKAQTVSVVLVEDELEARLNLHDFLKEIDWVDVRGEARDGGEAVELLERLRPDLVLLDVQLPVRSGLEVLSSLRYTPDVVFTTAHDGHALRAFELGAIDYLLKPFGRERFLAAMERVRQRRAAPPEAPGALERMRAALQSAPLERLFVRQGSRIVPVAVSDIVHIAAAGDYAEIRTAKATYLIHVALRDLSERLDPARFLRVHRSHVVNLDAVDHIAPFDERRLALCLRDGTEIVASRAASEALRGMAK